jgi:hypothetical protein
MSKNLCYYTYEGGDQMLVEALERKQKELGLTQVGMAQRLGVSEAMWSLVRRGLRNPGRGFIQAVLQQCPELSSEALIFLRGDVREVRTEFTTGMHAESRHASVGGSRTAKPPAKVSKVTRAKRSPKTEGGEQQL